ncbi:MAG: RsmB/NOP family class I SAM-dependent RNA methyltransferase [Burkholderiaceae bacterium]|nr:RsmB/NOP family class I SAM-dependent RNA methyltransferase [Burkholderiaceae bacterium]MCD8536631.1 RsmB/NOP family class I SAM-dependent RNA methyltransferase [Burkholderiaceae bacterium]
MNKSGTRDRTKPSGQRQSGRRLGKNTGKSSSDSAGSRRIEQVSEVLKQVLTWQQPADVLLSKYFRANPAMGARDRAQVAEAVFDVLRHLRRYRHHAQTGSGSMEVKLAAGGLFATLDESSRQTALTPDQLAWASHSEQIDPASLPFGLRFSVPDWIEAGLKQLPDPESYAASLLQGAPVDLRVNLLKGDRHSVLEQIQAQLQGSRFAAEATPYSPEGVRLTGHPPINRWQLFADGVIEVQDEGSQLLAHLVAPKRGEMVIDFCAGAGGKTLALGAMMRSTGRLYAFDVSAARLARAKPRFARSGLSNIHPVVIRHERDDRVARLTGKAHRVLVDAPCTGLGTLRRNPDLKWRQDPEQLARLCLEQASILIQAAKCVRPGGRLVYATCSFLREENEAQIEQFLEKHPEFTLINATECLPVCPTNAVDESGMLRLRPDWHGTDGFFAAVLQKQA